MAIQNIELPEIGKVSLRKHINSKTIKISIEANSTVKVSMPKWIPYKMAIKYVLSKKDWILNHQTKSDILLTGDRIGKKHTLHLLRTSDVATITSRKKGYDLWVNYPVQYNFESPEVQAKIREIAKKALRHEAEELLPNRLRQFAEENNFEVKSIEIRTLKARWGSCNSRKEITLNLYLMLLPWELIDYVIMHELSHTKAMHHGPDFWNVFESVMPDAKKRRREMKNYKPAL